MTITVKKSNLSLKKPLPGDRVKASEGKSPRHTAEAKWKGTIGCVRSTHTHTVLCLPRAHKSAIYECERRL